MVFPGQAAKRVALLLDSFAQPQWVGKIITDIRDSSIAETVLVILNNAPSSVEPARQPNFTQKVWHHRNDLVYFLYRKLDKRLFPVQHDAFHLVDAQTLLGNCPVIPVKPRQTAFSDYLDPDDFEKIRSYDLDVALRFGFRILRGNFLKIAKYGVWSYHHGDNFVNRGGPPGFWEVMEDSPITGSILQILSERLDSGKVIYRSYSATERHSVHRNKNNYYWKSAAFVMRKMQDLHELGPQALDEDRVNQVYQPYSQRLYVQPGNAEMARLMFGWARRYAAAKAAYHLNTYQWFLAYQLNKSETPATSLYRFKAMTPPKDRFWADPFPLKIDQKYFIFIEEFLFRTGKGHISAIEMDSDGNWQPPVKVLERPYHLSYPFVFQWGGETFMVPESADHKTVELYRCTSFPNQWALEQVLLDGVTAADATLAEIGGMWWMFVNVAVEGASKNDELHIFYADQHFGPWRAHRCNPVVSDARRARPAGRLFNWNGSWYRPSQDCSKTYGYAIVLNQITRLDRDCYEEQEVSRILPEWQKGILATHTFNSAGNLTVVDALKVVRKWG